MGRHRKREAVCRICGQVFQARTADMARGFARCCSPKCAGKAAWTTRKASLAPISEASRQDSGVGANSDKTNETRG